MNPITVFKTDKHANLATLLKFGAEVTAGVIGLQPVDPATPHCFGSP